MGLVGGAREAVEIGASHQSIMPGGRDATEKRMANKEFGEAADLNDSAVRQGLLMLASSPEPLNSAGYGRRRPIAAARSYPPAKTAAAI